MSRRRISVLGSTGSIGKSTLDVIAAHGGNEAYEVTALVAGSNAELMAEQALAMRPRIAVLRDESKLPELRARLEGSGIDTAAGQAALLDAVAEPHDVCVSAIVGADGLEPTLAAIRAGATLALANKESLVCAGALVRREAQKAGVTILPVDSEHNAIFQVLEQNQTHAIERLILTASGGPFRTRSLEEMRHVTPANAMAHPNWSMGASLSIDSATMFNKGLELIEAEQLFPVKADQIEILVHPQSIIHSMVGYSDGSVLAQMGMPDMRTPIAYALGWPKRVSAPVERLDLARIARLEFEPPDELRFPALRIAREALDAGGLAPCAMNAAKEVAVNAFVEGRVGFLDIAQIVEHVMQTLDHSSDMDDLRAVRAADFAARQAAKSRIAHQSTPSSVSAIRESR